MSHPKPITRRLHPHETPSQLAKAGYDTHAQAYLDWTISKPSNLNTRLHYLQQLLDFFAQDQGTSPSQATSQPADRQSRVLDLGCGTGIPVTLALAQSEVVQCVTATDISPTQLDLLRARLWEVEDGNSEVQKKVEVVESDMLDLELGKVRFDAVVAFFSLIHLARGDQRRMIQRIWGWLDVGGYLCANFGVQDDGKEGEVQDQAGREEESSKMTGTVVEDWLGMTAYWDGYGAEETKMILKDVGFEVVVADVVEEIGDAIFLWIIARKLGVS